MVIEYHYVLFRFGEEETLYGSLETDSLLKGVGVRLWNFIFEVCGEVKSENKYTLKSDTVIPQNEENRLLYEIKLKREGEYNTTRYYSNEILFVKLLNIGTSHNYYSINDNKFAVQKDWEKAEEYLFTEVVKEFYNKL